MRAGEGFDYGTADMGLISRRRRRLEEMQLSPRQCGQGGRCLGHSRTMRTSNHCDRVYRVASFHVPSKSSLCLWRTVKAVV